MAAMKPVWLPPSDIYGERCQIAENGTSKRIAQGKY